jgi:hypothetical protein
MKDVVFFSGTKKVEPDDRELVVFFGSIKTMKPVGRFQLKRSENYVLSTTSLENKKHLPVSFYVFPLDSKGQTPTSLNCDFSVDFS